MPYKWILEPIIGNLMLDLGGTTVSKASQPISELNVFEHSTKDLKTIPIICYETVYGEFVSNTQIKEQISLRSLVMTHGGVIQLVTSNYLAMLDYEP